MLATVEADQDQLKNLENRQEGLQADVDRIREREVIEAYIKKLKVAHLMSRYNEARSAFQAAKQRLKEGERNLKKLKEDSGPALKAIEAQSAYYQKVKGLEQGKIKAINDAEKESKRLLREAEDAATQFKDIKASIQAESSLLDTKRKDMGETRTIITRINGDLNRQPPEFNGVEWNQKIVSKFGVRVVVANRLTSASVNKST
jgi:chromosome segregation ATPase